MRFLHLLFIGLATVSSSFAAESCEKFVQSFRSTPLSAAQMPAIRDFQGPWPEGTYPLEAGYGQGCQIGEMAEIVAMCPDARIYPLIARAPVIASDPEGFTVVMIGREDHERLEGVEEAEGAEDKADMLLFYAQCR